MTWLRVFLSRVRGTLGRVHDDAGLRDEIRGHLELLTAKYVRQGMSLNDARLAARRQFGGVEQLKEAYRDQRGLRWLEDLGRDIRYALRTLRHAPGFSVVVVLILALAIGITAGIFTVVNSAVLRTLPVVEPERLAVLAAGYGVGRELRTWPRGVWEQLHVRAALFDAIAAWSTHQSFSLSNVGNESQTVDGIFVSGDFFKSLGVSAVIGRTLTAEDDVRGGRQEGPVAVISAALWQRRFRGAADVIGAPIVIDRIPFTVVGVTPPEFHGIEVGRTFDVAIPLGLEPMMRGTDSRLDNGAHWLRIMLRLKRDQSPAAATALLRSIQPHIANEAFHGSPTVNREAFLEQPLVAVPAAAGTSRLRYEYQRPLLALLTLAGLVLVIACANIANLLLARAVHRQHELQVRLALGAPRTRIARHLFTESVVLAACGGLVGVVVAAWGSRALVSQLSTPMTQVALDLSLDWRMLVFISVVSLATAVLSGTAPAFRGVRVPPVGALKRHQGGAVHGATPSRRARMTLPATLVVGQVALSVILVIAAGLFVRTLTFLSSRYLGFDPEKVLIVDLSAQRTASDPAARMALYEQAREAVRGVPGVTAASMSMLTPLSGAGYFGPDIQVSGPSAPPARTTSARTYANIVSPGWFETMGTPVIAGRDFTYDDRRGGRAVVIVNETWARSFLNGANPLGHTITIIYPYAGTPMEIVGLVADAVYVWLRDPPPATMYIPLAQFDQLGSLGSVSLSVRSAGGTSAVSTRSLSSALVGVNPGFDLRFRPLADHVEAALTQERLLAALSAVFGILALVLAALGIYGMTAYGVTRRRHEIGIRMALGARRSEVLALVLRRTMVVTMAGLAIGVAGAAAMTRHLESMLFELTPLDPATFLGTSLLFAAVAIVASYVPARRATMADPLITLRAE